MSKSKIAKIQAAPVLLFLLLFIATCYGAIHFANVTARILSLIEFRALGIVVFSVFYILILSLVICRLVLIAVPPVAGDVTTTNSFRVTYQIYGLFDLIVFTPILMSRLLPVPLAMLIYAALGTRFEGPASILGTICDPFFVRIGKDSLLGWDCLIVPHNHAGQRVELLPIHIGRHVTIGTRAIILAGVTIEDGAVIAAGAVVSKGTHVGAGEIWGGVPAKRIDTHGH